MRKRLVVKSETKKDMSSILKNAALAAKMALRFRFKRWSSTVAIVLFLLTATLLLFYLLPSGIEKETRPTARRFRGFFGDRHAYFVKEKLGNYEPVEKKPTGRLGDEGLAVSVEEIKDVDLNEVQLKKSEYGMNLVVSENIPYDRSIPDQRLDECKYWHYSEDLPTASVVIVFHNEGFSTLMRTVHSVLIRSPRKLLREVVLVDDFSNKEPLKENLDNYIIKTFGHYKETFDRDQYAGDSGRYGESLHERSGKVKLVRNSEREGLINSRTIGAKNSVGDVVVFLDAHCECGYNWLPPLLAPIAANEKTVTVPIIDGIDHDNFKYHPVYARATQHFRGIWEWGMYYKEIEVDMSDHLLHHKVSEPYDSPTHAGGLFAIDRKYFLTLGGYDPGLLVWGGENFELSFKVWQCGGRLQWVPCSRVGHIYRPFMPYSFGALANKRKDPLIATNYKRVIEVWWDDEFKEYFYTREPLARYYNAGDLSKQMELKHKLNCKSFTWFMENVASDVYKNFPKLPPNVHWGEMVNSKKKMCLDSHGSSPPQKVGLSHCHSLGGNQLMRLNKAGQLGVGERCIDAEGSSVTLIYCKLGTFDGPWHYDEQSRHMTHKKKNLCLRADPDENNAVYLGECNNEKEAQWVFKEIRR